MLQRPDEFYVDLGQIGGSDDLGLVYERLETDGRAWSATVGDEAGLIAFARSLPRRSREETMRMPSQPDHPEWETTQRLPYANPGDQRQQRPSRLRRWVAVVAAALVVALLGGSFYALRGGRNTKTPIAPTATAIQATATATSLPTAAITNVVVRTLSAAQYNAACQKVGGPYTVSYYQIGDMNLAIYLTGLAYPSVKLPAGTR
jgi:hypothetical protein